MDRPKVIHAIEVAKKDGLISEVMNNEKVSFRILDKGHQLLANSTEAVDLTAKECNQSDDCDSIPGSDCVEFKKFIHEEVLSLKALLSKQTISESGKMRKNLPLIMKQFSSEVCRIGFYLWSASLMKNKKLLKNYWRPEITMVICLIPWIQVFPWDHRQTHNY